MLISFSPVIIISFTEDISPDYEAPAHFYIRRVLESARKECSYKKTIRQKPYTFSASKVHPYMFKPEDRNCAEMISAVSSRPDLNPNYSINLISGEKSCSHEGIKEKLGGCSKRENGTW